MPAWAIALVQALPAILAAISAIIQQVNGKPTPAQQAQLDHLQKAHDSIVAALSQPE